MVYPVYRGRTVTKVSKDSRDCKENLAEVDSKDHLASTVIRATPGLAVAPASQASMVSLAPPVWKGLGVTTDPQVSVAPRGNRASLDCLVLMALQVIMVTLDGEASLETPGSRGRLASQGSLA